VTQKSKFRIGGTFTAVARDVAGNIKWRDVAKNLVVDVGLQAVLDQLFATAPQFGTPYVGLMATTPVPADVDTISVHAGWTEFEDYSGLYRITYTDVRTAETVSNTAAPAVFTIDTNASVIGGAFIVFDGVDIGGASGTLLCAAAFSAGDRTLDDTDTLTITYELTAADA